MKRTRKKLTFAETCRRIRSHRYVKYDASVVEAVVQSLEEAHGREVLNNIPGNVVAIRRACSDLCYAALSILVDYGNANEHLRRLGYYMDKAKAALAEPARNCDVGTAREQGKRYSSFCESMDGCKGCPVNHGDCTLEWGQLPYEKGGGE